MAEIVNLNRFKKARDARTREREAAENRTKFGRTRAEREREQAEEIRRREQLDGMRLQDDD